MSAMPARVTEQSGRPQVSAASVRIPRRVERRAEQKVARRSRQRWAVLSCSILGGAFGLTVGILDVLH
jgi:hypothetical protein